MLTIQGLRQTLDAERVMSYIKVHYGLCGKSLSLLPWKGRCNIVHGVLGRVGQGERSVGTARDSMTASGDHHKLTTRVGSWKYSRRYFAIAMAMPSGSLMFCLRSSWSTPRKPSFHRFFSSSVLPGLAVPSCRRSLSPVNGQSIRGLPACTRM